MSLHLVNYADNRDEQTTIDTIPLCCPNDSNGQIIIIGDSQKRYRAESFVLTPKIYPISDKVGDKEIILYNGLDDVNYDTKKNHQIFEVSYRLNLNFDASSQHKNLSLAHWKRLVIHDYGSKIIERSSINDAAPLNIPSHSSTNYSTRTAVCIIGCLISDKFIERWSDANRGDERVLDNFNRQIEQNGYLDKYFQFITLNDNVQKDLKVKLNHQFTDDQTQIGTENFYVDGDGTPFKLLSQFRTESLDPLDPSVDPQYRDYKNGCNMDDLIERSTMDNLAPAYQNSLDLSYLFTENFVNEHLLTRSKRRQYKTFVFITIFSNLDESDLSNRRYDYMFVSNTHHTIFLNTLVKTKNDRRLDDRFNRQNEYRRFKNFDQYFRSAPIIKQIYNRINPHNYQSTTPLKSASQKRRTLIINPPKILKEGIYSHNKRTTTIITDIM